MAALITSHMMNELLNLFYKEHIICRTESPSNTYLHRHVTHPYLRLFCPGEKLQDRRSLHGGQAEDPARGGAGGGAGPEHLALSGVLPFPLPPLLQATRGGTTTLPWLPNGKNQ